MTVRMKQYLITALIGMAALIVVFPSQAATRQHTDVQQASVSTR